MNNKGQVLIIFVILIPILIMIMSLIINLGLLYIEKRTIANDLNDAIVYYLNNSDNETVKEDTINLLNKNIDNIEIQIEEDYNYIIINIKKEVKSYSFFKLDNKIDITYKGDKISKKIIKG